MDTLAMSLTRLDYRRFVEFLSFAIATAAGSITFMN